MPKKPFTIPFSYLGQATCINHYFSRYIKWKICSKEVIYLDWQGSGWFFLLLFRVTSQRKCSERTCCPLYSLYESLWKPQHMCYAALFSQASTLSRLNSVARHSLLMLLMCSITHLQRGLKGFMLRNAYCIYVLTQSILYSSFCHNHLKSKIKHWTAIVVRLQDHCNLLITSLNLNRTLLVRTAIQKLKKKNAKG